MWFFWVVVFVEKKGDWNVDICLNVRGKKWSVCVCVLWEIFKRKDRDCLFFVCWKRRKKKEKIIDGNICGWKERKDWWREKELMCVCCLLFWGFERRRRKKFEINFELFLFVCRRKLIYGGLRKKKDFGEFILWNVLMDYWRRLRLRVGWLGIICGNLNGNVLCEVCGLLFLLCGERKMFVFVKRFGEIFWMGGWWKWIDWNCLFFCVWGIFFCLNVILWEKERGRIFLCVI